MGYTSVGAHSDRNDLYKGGEAGRLDASQTGTILGEYRSFMARPTKYQGRTLPDCMSIDFSTLWSAHQSNRMDPKYFLFKRDEQGFTPLGWIRRPIGQVLRKREEEFDPTQTPD